MSNLVQSLWQHRWHSEKRTQWRACPPSDRAALSPTPCSTRPYPPCPLRFVQHSVYPWSRSTTRSTSTPTVPTCLWSVRFRLFGRLPRDRRCPAGAPPACRPSTISVRMSMSHSMATTLCPAPGLNRHNSFPRLSRAVTTLSFDVILKFHCFICAFLVRP